MAAFLGDASLTLPQGRNALSITEMYLTIMENPFVSWRVMHSEQKSYSGGPKVISPRAARKVNAQQQQYFTIIYMKRNRMTELEATMKIDEIFLPSTSDSEISCVRILLKLYVLGRKKKNLFYPFLFSSIATWRNLIFFKRLYTNGKVDS